MSPLYGTDAGLFQRVAGHVVQAVSNGMLPRLSWRLGLLANERQALHARGSLARPRRHPLVSLGERLGREDLRPPKCDDCDNFDACFGSAASAPLKTWPLTPHP